MGARPRQARSGCHSLATLITRSQYNSSHCSPFALIVRSRVEAIQNRGSCCDLRRHAVRPGEACRYGLGYRRRHLARQARWGRRHPCTRFHERISSFSLSTSPRRVEPRIYSQRILQGINFHLSPDLLCSSGDPLLPFAVLSSFGPFPRHPLCHLSLRSCLLHPFPPVLPGVVPANSSETQHRHHQERARVDNGPRKVAPMQLRVSNPSHERACNGHAGYVPHASNRHKRPVVRVVQLMSKKPLLYRVDQRVEYAKHATVYNIVRDPRRAAACLCSWKP
jgi:hypothetical protein